VMGMFLRFSCSRSCSCSCSCSNFAHSVPGSPGGDLVARAFQPEHSAEGVCSSERQLSGVAVPLTPDPSPPFHGGEGRMRGQWPVWRAADGSPRVAVSVARAFQPEICSSAFGMPADRRCGAWRQVASREAAKGNAKGGGLWAFFRVRVRVPSARAD